MEIPRFDDTREFRQQADPLLLADEAPNNLILGVTGDVIERPNSCEAFLGWVVVDDGQPIAAAAQTVPHNLILGIPTSERAIELLANETGDIPGIVGCRPGADSLWLLDRRPSASRWPRGCTNSTPPPSLLPLTEYPDSPANSIYRRVGYRQVAESANYELSPKT